MEIQNTKCSSSKHSEIEAVSYCPECQKYLCNKCLKYHEEIEDHKTIILNERKEIFIDKCKVENHPNKLEFYCNEHNVLCCTSCLCKFKEYGLSLIHI